MGGAGLSSNTQARLDLGKRQERENRTAGNE